MNTCNCKSDFETFFANYIRRELFKQEVLNIVQGSNIINYTLLQNYVKGEVERKMKEAKSEIDTQVKNSVSNQLIHQMPIFLNQNAKMQELLNEHCTTLNRTLAQRANDTIQRTASEEGQKNVTELYKLRFKEGVDQKLQSLDITASRKLREMDEQYKKTVDSTMAEMRMEIGQLKQSKLRIEELEKKTHNQTIGLIGMSVSLLCTIGYIFSY